MSKHINNTQLIDVLGDMQTKADGRFSKGGGITFSTDANNNLQAVKANGSPITIGGGADIPLSVDNNGRLCITYETA